MRAGQCAHCRLPLPAHPQRETAEGETLLFCCVGCVLVFRVIGGAGEGGRADWFLAKLGLAALLSGNVMMFQSLTYFGTLEELGPSVARISSWIMLICSLGVFGLLGVPMMRVAGRGLLHGRLTLETLIGCGALAAIGFSAAQTLQGGHLLYFDSGTMVLVFVTLGQYLDAEARRRALALLSPTLGRARRPARLYRNGQEILIPPREVRAGECIHVRAGEEVPVDGTLLEGGADLHEPLLTGEWLPRFVTVGDSVNAGSTAIDGAFVVRASGAADTLADRVERFAVEARDRRAPIEASVDRVIAVFVPAVIAVAIGSCCLWGLAGQWARGFQAALAVLVVACPCALGIATPMATTIALSRAIGRGSLVRSGAVLEALSRVTAIAFDKTGTLTAGRPRVGTFRPAHGALTGSDVSLMLAAAVEREVSHPFARALVDFALARGVELPTALDVRVTAGGGARAHVSGHLVAVGNPAWLAAGGVSMAACAAPQTDACAALGTETPTGGSIVATAIDGRLAGEWPLDDPQRPEARAAVAALRGMGVNCQILSGDRRAVVEQLASGIGCGRWAAELSPADKPIRVQAMRLAGGLVAMVGDGVNDAPALATADVGIAFGPAADLARETADVTILREDLHEVPRLIALARDTFRIVRQNLAWAFAYNVVAIAFAAVGLLRPVYAAAAMVLSSVCVVGNSMRLSRTRGHTELPAGQAVHA
jgi:Cu2+-exporting ATPase